MEETGIFNSQPLVQPLGQPGGLTAQQPVAHGAEYSRDTIVALVRKWGGAASDAVLDPTMRNFHVPGIEGFISYRLERKCAVCFGDPICSPSHREILAKEFHRFAKDEGLHVVYVAVTRDYAHWALQNVCEAAIEFGEELLFNPPRDPRKNTGVHAQLVRRKTKQAIRSGVSVHEYIPHDAAIESGFEQVKTLWLQSRKGIQTHISNVYLFSDRLGKRWFYARLNDQIVGVVILNSLEKQKGWLLNHLMVLPDAPNGVSELLIASILEILEKEGCPYATAGFIAAQKLGEMTGFNRFSKALARWAFKIASKIIYLEGLNMFWNKFFPQSQPSYLLFSRKRIGLAELFALKRAMNGSFRESRL